MWKVKVAIQFVLSKIPFGEQVNFYLQNMNNSHSLQNTESRIMTLINEIIAIKPQFNFSSLVVVEIGTGWDSINALVLYALGVKTCYTYDHVAHVRFKLAMMVVEAIKNKIPEISALTSISEEHLYEKIDKISGAASLKDLFSKAGIIYNAPGDASKTGLPDHSVDIVYSYAVLEHVAPAVISEFDKEAKRILKKDGLVFHVIGLHDHYTGIGKGITKVNFLQYSERVWSFFIYNKIAYHNRLREKTFIELFKKSGAKVISVSNEIDDKDIEAIKKMKLADEFSGFSPEELAIFKTRVLYTFSD